MDFAPKTSVTEGAVAPACQFDLAGKHFVAVSPDAPFYQELMDKNQNDSFVFNGKGFTIEFIF